MMSVIGIEIVPIGKTLIDMTYIINVERRIFSKWKSYCEDWDLAEYHSHLLENYPEVVSVRLTPGLNREFTFESEEHYHWFLLKQ